MNKESILFFSKEYELEEKIAFGQLLGLLLFLKAIKKDESVSLKLFIFKVTVMWKS